MLLCIVFEVKNNCKYTMKHLIEGLSIEMLQAGDQGKCRMVGGSDGEKQED